MPESSTFSKSVWHGIEGIVLDAVGTLIEPDPAVPRVYRDAAARQGVAMEVDDVRARFHRHFRIDEVDETLGPLVTDEPTELRRWRRIVSAVLPEVPDSDRAFEELWAHFAQPEAWKCFPDVAPALQALESATIPVRIASNFDGRLHDIVSGLSELSGLDHSLVISSEIGFRKPHPRFYEITCDRLGLSPERVLFVGDDLENDVLGPTRAGLRSVLVVRENKGAGADMRWVRNLVELVAARIE